MKSISFVAFCVLAAAAGWARSIELDLRPAAALQSTASVVFERGVLRRSSLAAGAASAKNLAVGDRLALRLYHDVELKLMLVEREESPLTGPTFQASAEGVEGLREAVVIETPEGLLVSAQDRRLGRFYSIVSAADGVTVKEIDPAAEPSHCGGVVEPSPFDLGTPGEEAAATPKTATGDQSANVVDMLVAYDLPAASWAKQNGGITNLAQQCVARMNTALANSGLASTFRFRLVGVTAVGANGNGDLDQSLSDVKDGTGSWAPVKAMRDTVGADIVSTMIDTGSAYGTTGLGYSLTGTGSSRIASFASSAYNVISVRAAAQSHVMTHETGHNMGAGHSDMQEGHPEPQSCNYSRGYYFRGADNVDYYTIMAYNVDAEGNRYEQAPLFSTPNAAWQGKAAGDSTHNNAQVLRDTCAGVANFRAQKVPMSYDVFFSPEPGSLFSGSTTVALTPGKSGVPIRYTLDGSTPTASHGALYSGPITITTSTTIKAVAVVDGHAGMVYEASYYVSDLGTALNAPQLVWSTSDNYPWTVQSATSYDGALAVKSPDPFPVEGRNYHGENSWLKTTVTGPTKMSFRYSQRCYTPGFEVSVGGNVVFGLGESNWGDWALAEIDIPAGSHEVKFSWTLYGAYYNGFNGVALDMVQFDALSRSPVISPASTTEVETARTFTGSMQLTMTPGMAGGAIYYTLDGSDPAGEGGLLYVGPVTLTKSTRVRAVEIDSGKDPSADVGALYLERHPLAAGEWTTDVDGVKTAAAKDGKLICVLLANLATCGWCRAFDTVANSKTFLTWAKANGVYLVTGDASTNLDADAAQDWFWTLRSSAGESGSVGYPTMFFAKPSAPNQSVGKGLARDDGSSRIGSVLYSGTVESLIEGISSILRANGYSPVAAPVSVADILETTGVTWTNSSAVPWREEYPNQMRAGGLMSSTFSSTLSAKVSGKGKFIFSYKAVSYSSRNSFKFAVNGSTQWTRKYDGNTTYGGTITNNVASASGATFTWTCTVDSSSSDYSSCGAWLYDVQWIPEGSGVTRRDGQGNTVVIPSSWFTANGIAAADADADADGDGLCNWHEYVCGTNPRNAEDVLRCTIKMVNGAPVVDYEPKIGYLAGYHAVVLGASSLEAPNWSVNCANPRFFKVVLEK